MEVSDRSHAASRRARIGVGVAFIAVAMVLASVLAGLGFASSTPSSAQYQYGKTIAICHHTGSSAHPWVTLHVDIHSWPFYLQHGDTLGACAGTTGTQTPGQNQDGKKVAICHYVPAKTPPWVTLHIDLHAWPGHLKHGDHLGPCGNNLPPSPTHHGPPHGHGHGHGQ